MTLVYQSTILTASPFLSVSMNHQEPHVAIGTSDGVVGSITTLLSHHISVIFMGHSFWWSLNYEASIKVVLCY